MKNCRGVHGERSFLRGCRYTFLYKRCGCNWKGGCACVCVRVCISMHMQVTTTCQQAQTYTHLHRDTHLVGTHAPAHKCTRSPTNTRNPHKYKQLCALTPPALPLPPPPKKPGLHAQRYIFDIVRRGKVI